MGLALVHFQKYWLLITFLICLANFWLMQSIVLKKICFMKNFLTCSFVCLPKALLIQIPNFKLKSYQESTVGSFCLKMSASFEVNQGDFLFVIKQWANCYLHTSNWSAAAAGLLHNFRSFFLHREVRSIQVWNRLFSTWFYVQEFFPYFFSSSTL